MLNNTSCRAETLYLLGRALRTRGFMVRECGTDSLEARGFWGSFCLSLMPHNRRVLISYGALVSPEYRGKGYGKKLLELREEIAVEVGCNLLLATVRDDNAVQVHLLESHGWKRYNQRDTGVSLWGKEL